MIFYLNNRTTKMVTPQQDFISVLKAQEINYPHEAVNLDTITGSNYREFLLNAKKWVKQLEKKGLEPLTENFNLHLGFIETFNGERIKYYPMSLEFANGQILVGLARQYGEAESKNQIQRKEPIKITKWFLNGEDITKLVYPTREAIKEQAIEIKNIVSLIKGAQGEFNVNLKDTLKELESYRDELKEAVKLKKEGANLKLENDEYVLYDSKNNEIARSNDLEEIKQEIELQKGQKELKSDLLAELEKVIKDYPLQVNYDAGIYYLESDDGGLIFSSDDPEYFKKEVLKEVKALDNLYSKVEDINKLLKGSNYLAEYDMENMKFTLQDKDTNEVVLSESKFKTFEAKVKDKLKDKKDLLTEITNDPLYKQILDDSMGGIMYNVADYTKYNKEDLQKLYSKWEKLKNKDSANGITKGAMDFIKEALNADNNNNNNNNNNADELLNKVFNAKTIDDLVSEDIEQAVNDLEEMYKQKELTQEQYDKLNEHLTKVATNA
jgi:hypothetical protein